MKIDKMVDVYLNLSNFAAHAFFHFNVIFIWKQIIKDISLKKQLQITWVL